MVVFQPSGRPPQRRIRTRRTPAIHTRVGMARGPDPDKGPAHGCATWQFLLQRSLPHGGPPHAALSWWGACYSWEGPLLPVWLVSAMAARLLPLPPKASPSFMPGTRVTRVSGTRKMSSLGCGCCVAFSSRTCRNSQQGRRQIQGGALCHAAAPEHVAGEHNSMRRVQTRNVLVQYMLHTQHIDAETATACAALPILRLLVVQLVVLAGRVQLLTCRSASRCLASA